MIKNLNILILKISMLKLKSNTNFFFKDLREIKTNFLYTNSFLIDFYNTNHFTYFNKNQPHIKYNYSNFYKMYYIFFFRFIFFFIFQIKNKIIFFYQISSNFLYKYKYIFFKSFNNFFSNNKLNFYKNYNKIYKNYKSNTKNKNFFILKKKKEHINPNFFMNYNNFLKPQRIFKKINKFNSIFKNQNINVIFFKKDNHEIIKKLNMSTIFFLNKKINLNSFKNGVFVKKHRLKPLTKVKKILNYKIKIKNFPININNAVINIFNKLNKNPYRINNKNNNLSNLIQNSHILYKTILYTSSCFVFNFYKSKNKFKSFKILNKKNIKSFILKSKLACLNLIYINDFYYNNFNIKNFFFLSNSFFLKSFKTVTSLIQIHSKNNKKFHFYNNYYPVIYFNKSKGRFLSKFKSNSNVNYVSFFNSYVLSFLENFFKKRFFLKPTNNRFHKTQHTKILLSIHNNYKNYQPKYMKNFLIIDFLEIFWYSLYLKDLNMISSWLCNFLEKTHFRFHRKFILFFQNFFHKNESIFFNFLKIKGFFFDIRGKVGVAGNSKKRHYFFKTGVLGKSIKKNKMAFKQSVVRTPSGALGLSIIISY